MKYFEIFRRSKNQKKIRRKARKKATSEKLRLKTRQEALKHSITQLQQLYHNCMDNIVPVTEPLVLISQIQRSGGSLLSQLFDGHPQLHAHPSELMIGYPRKHIWPTLDLDDSPERWFDILFEDKVIEHFRDGYKKGKRSEQSFAFQFLPALQKMIFMKCLSNAGTPSLIEIYTAYMTSYFGAWLNNQNYTGSKKFVTAFTPRLAVPEKNVEAFFKIYPQGRIISVIRDPKNWYPSAVRHSQKSKKYSDINIALQQWRDSARAMVRNKDRWGDKVGILKFEDLVTNTEAIMRHLAEFLGINFEKILLFPTFNKYLINANTSFESSQSGILKSTVTRYNTLSDQELKTIAQETAEDYEKVLTKVTIK